MLSPLHVTKTNKWSITVQNFGLDPHLQFGIFDQEGCIVVLSDHIPDDSSFTVSQLILILVALPRIWIWIICSYHKTPLVEDKIASRSCSEK